MARKIIWTNEATDDLEVITEYISRDSVYYAASFVQKILDTTRTLSQFVERGRIVPEFNKADVRELFVKEHRLIYKVEEFRIVILGIIHGKRDLATLWERERRS